MREPEGIYFFAERPDEPLYALRLLDDEYAFVDETQLDQLIKGEVDWLDRDRIIYVSRM